MTPLSAMPPTGSSSSACQVEERDDRTSQSASKFKGPPLTLTTSSLTTLDFPSTDSTTEKTRKLRPHLTTSSVSSLISTANPHGLYASPIYGPYASPFRRRAFLSSTPTDGPDNHPSHTIMTPLSATPPANSSSSAYQVEEHEVEPSQSASTLKGSSHTLTTSSPITLAFPNKDSATEKTRKFRHLLTSAPVSSLISTDPHGPYGSLFRRRALLSSTSTDGPYGHPSHTINKSSRYASDIAEPGHSSFESPFSRITRGIGPVSPITTPSLSLPSVINMLDKETPSSKLSGGESESELRDLIEDIGQQLDEVVEKSTKGPAAQASFIINLLTLILRELIEQYRRLQEEAPKDIETRIVSLFSKYSFSTLRIYFWRLSALSDTHCHKEKMESLACLIKCLENDPICPASEPGLLKLLDNVVHYLNDLYNSPSQLADFETTERYLQIFTLISEVCAWHNENESKIKLDDQLIERARKVLAIINVRHPEPDKEQWYKAWNMRLQCNIARAALHNLTADRSTLKNLFDIASPLTNNAKNFASSRDIVSAIEGAFKTFNSAYDQNQAKMLHSKWYVKLFAIRKAMHELTSESDKVKLLQASLKQNISGDFSWEFIAEVLHLLGRLGLESQNHNLMYSICSGLSAKKDREERLPGLVHFRHRQIDSLLQTAFIPESHITYLAQLAQNYAYSIIQRLPSDKQHEKIIRLLNAWFPSFDSTSQVKRDSDLHIDTLARQLESLDDQSKSKRSEPKHSSYSLESSPWSAILVDHSQLGKKLGSDDSSDKSHLEPIVQTKQTHSDIHSRETQMKVIQANEPLFLYYHSFKILFQGMLIASGAIEVGMIGDARKQQLEKIAAYLMTLSSSLPPSLEEKAAKAEIDFREKVISFFSNIGSGKEVHKLAGLFKGRDAHERTDRLAIELTLAQEEALHKIRAESHLPTSNATIRRGRVATVFHRIIDFAGKAKEKLSHLIDVVKSRIYENSCDDPIVQKAGIDFATILSELAETEADVSSRWTIPDLVSIVCGEDVKIADPMSPRTELEHAFKQQREALLKVTKQMEALQAQLGTATTKINPEVLTQMTKHMEAQLETLTQNAVNTGTKFAANKQRFEATKTHHQLLETPHSSQEIDASAINVLVARSRQGPVPEASDLINRLSSSLDSLIKEYRILQAAEASSAKNQQIADLFYYYPKLRSHFWQLSHLSAIHCYDEKLKCLSHLMRCLEYDPIIPQSREGLDYLLGDVVNYLAEMFPTSSSTTTSVPSSWNEELNVTLVQVLTLLLEIYWWHTERHPSLSLNDSTTKRAQSILKVIESHLIFSIEEVSNYREWDLRLHHEIAQIAFNSFLGDRTALKALFMVASPLVEGVQKGTFQNAIITVMNPLFQAVAKAHGSSSIKSSHSKWYVNLFSMRQAIRHIADDAHRLRLLQASLLQRGAGFPWQFAGNIVHMMGKLGLECQNPELRHDICYGQKVSKESSTHLPGLVDIQDQKLRIHQPIIVSETIHKNQMAYLAQLAKSYFNAIIDPLPKTLSGTSPTHSQEKESYATSGPSSTYIKELEEIGKKIGNLIQRSRKGAVSEVSEAVSTLSSFLSTLIKEYRVLQADEASPEREAHISALFSNWQFSTLRRYFWQLSHLSARHCYENKLECLSYLRECLENDPITSQSREGLVELVSDIANHLEIIFPSTLSKADSGSVIKTMRFRHSIDEEEFSVIFTKELLRILKLISQVWLCHKEKDPTMVIAGPVFNKMEKALQTIDGRYVSTENLVYNRTEWDLKLNFEIAQAAIKNFSADREALKALFDIASPVVETANQLVSKQEITSVTVQLFQAVTKAYNSSSLKSWYNMWYVNLFSIRKAVRQIPIRSYKVRFLQASLLVLSSRMNWQFTGDILEIIGKLGRESKDQKLRYDICMGQQASKDAEGHLPGLIHFHRKLISVFHSPTELKSIYENRVYHLAKLAQHYADMIIAGLQPGKEKDQLIKLFKIENNVDRKRQAQLSTLIEERSAESS